MVVTRAGGIPLVWHAYPGNRPDVTQFPTLIGHLAKELRVLGYEYVLRSGEVASSADKSKVIDVRAAAVAIPC
jgi:transposase